MATTSRFAVGTPLKVEMTKWGDRPHWRYAAYYLGADAHGDWLGTPAGTHHYRPGAAFDAEVDKVVLVPAGAGHIMERYAHGLWCDVYVDITTDPVWDGTTLRAVDLDLDVVRRADGTVYVDDEDEFAEHQIRYGYPDEVIARAESVAATVFDAVCGSRAPYDATAESWLAAVTGLTPLPPP